MTACLPGSSAGGAQWADGGWLWAGLGAAQNRSNRALNTADPKGFQAEAPSIISPLRPLAGELCLWMIPQRAQSQLLLWQGRAVGSCRNETSKGRRGGKERTQYEQSAGQSCLSNRLGEGSLAASHLCALCFLLLEWPNEAIAHRLPHTSKAPRSSSLVDQSILRLSSLSQ